MRWLPVFLSLCGFNPGQSIQLASMVEAVWLTGSFFPARPSGGPRKSRDGGHWPAAMTCG